MSSNYKQGTFTIRNVHVKQRMYAPFPPKKPTYTNENCTIFRADIVIFDTRIAEIGPSGFWPFPPEIGDPQKVSGAGGENGKLTHNLCGLSPAETFTVD